MKHLFLLLFAVLPFSFLRAQEHEATLYFLDGTTVTGYASLKFVKESFYGIPKDKIAFSVTSDDEPDLWDDEMVSKVEFHGFGTPAVFEYIPVKYVDGVQSSLFQVLVTGEVNLYAEASGVWDTKNDDLKTPLPKHLYAKRANEETFAVLSNKKKIAEYFNQCPGIKEGLDDGTFSSRTVEELVDYYNTSCASKK